MCGRHKTSTQLEQLCACQGMSTCPSQSMMAHRLGREGAAAREEPGLLCACCAGNAFSDLLRVRDRVDMHGTGLQTYVCVHDYTAVSTRTLTPPTTGTD